MMALLHYSSPQRAKYLHEDINTNYRLYMRKHIIKRWTNKTLVKHTSLSIPFSPKMKTDPFSAKKLQECIYDQGINEG